MQQPLSIKVTLITAILCAGLVENAMAASGMVTSTIVTHAVSTKDPLTFQELTSVEEIWTFEEILGAQKLTSKINQVDGKSIIQTWDEANGNKLNHTDAEGRTTKYTYNATNQRDSMTEAFETPQARTTTYEYLSADIDLVTKTTSPSIYSSNDKEVINTYDERQNITKVTINGFDAQGLAVSRVATFDHDQYGKVDLINGPRTDVDDITILEYYDCNTGAECGQLKKVTNALGHVSTYDDYDAASRLKLSTDPNGVVTRYDYHPRGWLLKTTQTPPLGQARITTYDYDNAGQLKKVTLADGSEQNYVYDDAHDLREVFDNLGNKVEYTYDPKGNRTHTLIRDPNSTLVRSTITTYNHRNFIQSIDNAGSITQLINDAVGNLSTQTDPKENPDTSNTFDALDRLSNTVDALNNNSTYAYDVADQLSQATSPNGSVTQYEYDDLGNQTKEISIDRGTLVYSHDGAGNVLSMTDARSVTASYTYDALNRLTSVSYPLAGENISYSYDLGDDQGANYGFAIGRLCQIDDAMGTHFREYDPWGNVLSQTWQTDTSTFSLTYAYDALNRVSQISYPSGLVIDYVRDAIGRVEAVHSPSSSRTEIIADQFSYRADGLIKGHRLGSAQVTQRSYDLQGRLESQ
ncbi:MAG: YD repeat-containing protein, partial [Arenicella sp.]